MMGNLCFALLSLLILRIAFVNAQTCTVTISHPQATYTVPRTSTVYITDTAGAATVTTTSTQVSVSTSTVVTVTLSSTLCPGNNTLPSTTVYTPYASSTSAGPARYPRAPAIQRRQELGSCSTTSTSNYYPPAKSVTATTTVTYFGATATTTKLTFRYSEALIAASTTTTIYSSSCATVTQADICAPSVQASSLDNHGLSYLGELVSSPGTTFITTTICDPGACCQLCVDSDLCSASAFNVQTGECHLEFLVQFTTSGPPWGPPQCGPGLYAVEGTNLEAGERWYVQGVCGRITVIPPEV